MRSRQFGKGNYHLRSSCSAWYKKQIMKEGRTEKKQN
jgi:hypothetical protein